MQAQGRRQHDAMEAVRTGDEGCQNILLTAQVLTMHAEHQIAPGSRAHGQMRDDFGPKAAEGDAGDTHAQVRSLFEGVERVMIYLSLRD